MAKTVIIGGGIIGINIAAHLAQKRIVDDVFLLEGREQPGMGETAASAAMLMFNTHINDPTLIKLAGAAKREYGLFEEKFGIGSEIQHCGSLLVSVTDEGATRMENQVHLQNENGINSQFLSAKEIHEQYPFLRGDDITAGIYCSADGYIVDQIGLVRKLRDYAVTKGINVLCNTRVIKITKSTEGIIIDTDRRGSLETEKVIITAGGQSSKLTRSLGYNLPLTYSTRTLWVGNVNNSQIITPIIEFIDGENEGYYFRPPTEGSKQCLVAVGPTQDSNQDPGTKIASFDKDLAEGFLATRFPEFRVKDLTGNPGTRSMTPDGLAYLGPLDPGKQINVAFGLSGYGITLAPIFGQEGANLLVEGGINKEFQASLSPERFRQHRTVEGL